MHQVRAAREPLEGQPRANVAGSRVPVGLDRVEGQPRTALERGPGLRIPRAGDVHLEPAGRECLGERDHMARNAAVERLRRQE